MPNNIQKVPTDGLTSASGRATGNTSIVVWLAANNRHRVVEVKAFIDDAQIGAASAADNFVEGVISSASQTLTLPVPANANWKIDWNVVNGPQEEVTIWVVK